MHGNLRRSIASRVSLKRRSLGRQWGLSAVQGSELLLWQLLQPQPSTTQINSLFFFPPLPKWENEKKDRWDLPGAFFGVLELVGKKNNNLWAYIWSSRTGNRAVVGFLWHGRTGQARDPLPAGGTQARADWGRRARESGVLLGHCVGSELTSSPWPE